MMRRLFLSVILICVLLAASISPAAAQSVNCSSRIDHLTVGQESLIVGDYATAIAHFDCTINGIGRSVDAYLGRMLARMLSGEMTAANADIVSAFDMGGIEVFENAVDWLDDVIDGEPTSSAYAARGILQWLIGDDGEAVVDDLSEAIELGEDTPVVYLVRGLTRYNYSIGSTDVAFADIKRALSEAPNDGEFHRLAGNAYYTSGDNEQGIALLEKALEIEPDYADFHADLADIYLNENDYEAAIENYDRYLALTPSEDQYVNVYFNIGFAYDKMGERETASGYFYQFLTIARFDFIDEDSLEINEPVRVDMSSGLVYEFTIRLTEGQVVDFSAESPSGRVDPLLVVLGPDGVGVTANDDRSEENYNSFIRQFVVPETGRYTVLVSHAFGGSEGGVDVEVIIQSMDI